MSNNHHQPQLNVIRNSRERQLYIFDNRRPIIFSGALPGDDDYDETVMGSCSMDPNDHHNTSVNKNTQLGSRKGRIWNHAVISSFYLPEPTLAGLSHENNSITGPQTHDDAGEEIMEQITKTSRQVEIEEKHLLHLIDKLNKWKRANLGPRNGTTYATTFQPTTVTGTTSTMSDMNAQLMTEQMTMESEIATQTKLVSRSKASLTRCRAMSLNVHMKLNNNNNNDKANSTTNTANPFAFQRALINGKHVTLRQLDSSISYHMSERQPHWVNVMTKRWNKLPLTIQKGVISTHFDQYTEEVGPAWKKEPEKQSIMPTSNTQPKRPITLTKMPVYHQTCDLDRKVHVGPLVSSGMRETCKHCGFEIDDLAFDNTTDSVQFSDLANVSFKTGAPTHASESEGVDMLSNETEHDSSFEMTAPHDSSGHDNGGKSGKKRNSKSKRATTSTMLPPIKKQMRRDRVKNGSNNNPEQGVETGGGGGCGNGNYLYGVSQITGRSTCRQRGSSQYNVDKNYVLHLLRKQGKETKLPQAVINKVNAMRIQMGVPIRCVTVDLIVSMLRKLKMCHYYNNANQICHRITGVQPLQLNPEHTEQLIDLQSKFISTWSAIRGTRKSLIRYNILSHWYCHMLGLYQYFPMFPLIDDRAKLYHQMYTYIDKACVILEWPRVPPNFVNHARIIPTYNVPGVLSSMLYSVDELIEIDEMQTKMESDQQQTETCENTTVANETVTELNENSDNEEMWE